MVNPAILFISVALAVTSVSFIDNVVLFSEPLTLTPVAESAIRVVLVEWPIFEPVILMFPKSALDELILVLVVISEPISIAPNPVFKEPADTGPTVVSKLLPPLRENFVSASVFV